MWKDLSVLEGCSEMSGMLRSVEGCSEVSGMLRSVRDARKYQGCPAPEGCSVESAHSQHGIHPSTSLIAS